LINERRFTDERRDVASAPEQIRSHAGDDYYGVFNKSVENFVEKAAPDYGKVKILNGF